ncbi:MAG: hypothetical protein ACP5M9_01145 [Candidatus Micrarchaeia archaeon]
MAKSQKRIEKELLYLKSEIALLSAKEGKVPTATSEGDINLILKYMLEEREKTNKILYTITEKIKKLEQDLSDSYVAEQEPISYSDQLSNKEVPLSALDVKILNFAQSKGMISAEDLRIEMNYKGKNAACARLNKLYKQGLLDRFQLGHKVYYKFDAGKATNTLIISPPR